MSTSDSQAEIGYEDFVKVDVRVGTVVRVEGHGPDLTVTVDFPDHGRKHILPRFAPLYPVD